MRAVLLLGCTLFLALAACAPRQNRTHFERWDEFAANNAEDHEDAAGNADPKMSKAPKVTPMKAAPRKANPPPPAPPTDYSSLGNDTPAIGGTKTATASRVVKPEPEDEPIY